MKTIPDANRSGLYIIARFEEKPSGVAHPNVQELIYIGETHGKSQSIRKRLQKFFQASKVGGKFHKHSGGNRFNRTIGDDLTNIYAAIFSPNIEDDRFLTPFILYAERKLIWDYVVKWGDTPLCNEH